MRGPRYLSAYTAIAWLQVANIGQTSIRYGLKGYCKTPVNDVIGGLDALGLAYRAIRRSAADILVTGGCESFLHPFSLTVIGHEHEITYCVAGDDPTSYRPFDRRAGGLILAEGAGVCILEEYEHAKQRNAPIYGEIVGYGQTNDANGPTPPSSNGRQYARAIRLALREAGLAPAALGYVSLDGRAYPLSDQGEADALHRFSVPTRTAYRSACHARCTDTALPPPVRSIRSPLCWRYKTTLFPRPSTAMISMQTLI